MNSLQKLIAFFIFCLFFLLPQQIFAASSTPGSRIWSNTTTGSQPGIAPSTQCASNNSSQPIYYASEATIFAYNSVTGDTLWTYVAGDIEQDPTVAINGEINTSSCLVLFNTVGGTVYVLDGSTGDVRWSSDTGDPQKGSSILLGNGVIYYAGSSTIHAFSTSTGNPAWTYTIGDIVTDPSLTITSSPIFGGQNIIFTTKGGSVYTLDKNTGAMVGSYNAGPIQNGIPPLYENSTYGGPYILYSVGSTLYALNRFSGFVWSYSTGDLAQNTSLAINSTIAYNATGYGLIYFSGRNGTVYAVNSSDGLLAWSTPTSGGAKSTTSLLFDIPTNILYYPGASDLYAIDGTTGAILWSTPIPNSSAGVMPLLDSTEDVLYYTGGAKLYAIDRTTGAILWSYTTGNLSTNANFAINGSPVMPNGSNTNVYFDTIAGTVYAVGRGRTQITPPNQAPVIDTLSDVTIIQGATYSANGSFTDNDSTSWTGTVDYGDQTGSTSLPITNTTFPLQHSYTTTGTFTVVITITDNQGEAATKNLAVTVTPPSTNQTPTPTPNVPSPTPSPSPTPGAKTQCSSVPIPTGWVITNASRTAACGGTNSFFVNTYIIQQAVNNIAVCSVNGQVLYPEGWVITSISKTSACGGTNSILANTFTIHQPENNINVCSVIGNLTYPNAYVIIGVSKTAACGGTNSLFANTYTLHLPENNIGVCSVAGNVSYPSNWQIIGSSKTAACGGTNSLLPNTYKIHLPENNTTLCSVLGNLSYPSNYVVVGVSRTAACGGTNTLFPNTYTIHLPENNIGVCSVGGNVSYPNGWKIVASSRTNACGGTNSLFPNTYTIRRV